MWQIWLIISGFCLVLEIMTAGFLVFWFAVGALVALLCSFITDSIIIQTAIFIISSTILLFATKPVVNAFLKNVPDYRTNSSSIEGQIGIVTKDIDPTLGVGQIKVNGEVWSAKSSDNTVIPAGQNVTIEKLEGVKAIVKVN